MQESNNISLQLYKNKKPGFLSGWAIDIRNHICVYIMALFVIAYYILFKYVPMYGALIAFQDYVPIKGMMGSTWVGFKHLNKFFQDPYFFRLLKNTLTISVLSIVFEFPVPIIFALMLNEVRSSKFKKVVQTTTYLPHFISLMVVCGMITTFTSRTGLINSIIAFFGGERSNLLTRPELFRPIYIISDIWQSFGWNSIVYLAALSAVDTEQYEAAAIDGASKLKQIWHVTLPGILPTVVTMFILRLGGLMSVGYQKIILLANDMTFETADVISFYVYRRGILGGEYSFSTAVGLFNSVINIIMVISANYISRRVNETSLW